MSEVICVIGQGYVGLPLALSFAEKDFVVLGLEVNLEKIKMLKAGLSPIEGVSNSKLEGLTTNRKYKATSDYSVVSNSDVIIICVPTPLDEHHKPDTSDLTSCIRSLSRYIQKGALLIIESTIAPGTIKNELIPLLEKESGLSIDNFDLAYSSERVDPLNKVWDLKNTPKVVAGLDSQSQTRAKNLYLNIVDTVIESSSIEAAETAKLLENSFRLINISLINEITIFCQIFGIDVSEVIRLASSKPYGFMPFYPGLGAGGHCIPVDPMYLAEKSREAGMPITMIETAEKVNRRMPAHFVELVESKFKGSKSKRILVIGVSYKPNVSDVRETPVEAVLNGLRAKGFEVFWHDDLVAHWNGEASTPISNNYDLAILATRHDYLDLSMLGDTPVMNTIGSVL